jgi:hypothetical protein
LGSGRRRDINALAHNPRSPNFPPPVTAIVKLIVAKSPPPVFETLGQKCFCPAPGYVSKKDGRKATWEAGFVQQHGWTFLTGVTSKFTLARSNLMNQIF